MPGKHARILFAGKARAECDVRAPIENWSQKSGQFRWSVAVISVEKNDHIRTICVRKPRQTSAAVSAAQLSNNASALAFGDLGSAVSGIAVDHDDFRDAIGRKIGEHTADGLRFVMGRNDNGDSHATWPVTTTGMTGCAAPETSQLPKLDRRVPRRLRALPALGRAAPRSMLFPIPRPRGCPGIGMPRTRPAASAGQGPGEYRARFLLALDLEPPAQHGLRSDP